MELRGDQRLNVLNINANVEKISNIIYHQKKIGQYLRNKIKMMKDHDQYSNLCFLPSWTSTKFLEIDL